MQSVKDGSSGTMKPGTDMLTPGMVMSERDADEALFADGQSTQENAREAWAREQRILAHMARVAKECPQIVDQTQHAVWAEERRHLCEQMLHILRQEPDAWFRTSAFSHALLCTHKRATTCLRHLVRQGLVVRKGNPRQWYWRLITEPTEGEVQVDE